MRTRPRETEEYARPSAHRRASCCTLRSRAKPERLSAARHRIQPKRQYASSDTTRITPTPTQAAKPRCGSALPYECKLGFAEEHVIAQSKERGTREAPRAHMRNAKLPRPTVRRAHQHVTRPFEPQTRMIPLYALKRRAELFGARGALGDAWFSAPHRS